MILPFFAAAALWLGVRGGGTGNVRLIAVIDGRPIPLSLSSLQGAGGGGDEVRVLRLDLSLIESLARPLMGGNVVVACEASEVSDDVKPPSAVRDPEKVDRIE